MKAKAQKLRRMRRIAKAYGASDRTANRITADTIVARGKYRPAPLKPGRYTNARALDIKAHSDGKLSVEFDARDLVREPDAAGTYKGKPVVFDMKTAEPTPEATQNTQALAYALRDCEAASSAGSAWKPAKLQAGGEIERFHVASAILVPDGWTKLPAKRKIAYLEDEVQRMTATLRSQADRIANLHEEVNNLQQKLKSQDYDRSQSVQRTATLARNIESLANLIQRM